MGLRGINDPKATILHSASFETMACTRWKLMLSGTQGVAKRRMAD